jgi:phosphate transport system permease protein
MSSIVVEPLLVPEEKAVSPPMASMVPARRAREKHLSDRIFFWTLRCAGLGVVLLLLLIGFFLFQASRPALAHFGWSFLTSQNWDPVSQEFGALAVVYGTVVSSLIAMLIATPMSIGVALFLNELAPRPFANLVGFLVEMLAAIPSVVYGLWGIFLLAPWMRATVQPFLAEYFGFLPFFQGPPYGVGMITAGVILSIMVTPTVCSICREVFRAVPRSNREAALALGATRWESMKVAVLRASRVGIVGAVILGLGRALGETMAVTMVIGNRAEIALSLFAPSQTMASVIANEYAEASNELHLAALAEVGLLLFAVTFVINSVARVFVWRVKGQMK